MTGSPDGRQVPSASFTDEDSAFMRQAIALAEEGSGWVNPNPQVGCVIVRDGRVIARGFHGRFGGPHAEREALADAAQRGEEVAGSTVYVTLEPCSHHGKTPPCADALIEAAPARVVIGSLDPNPQVAGRGIARLSEAGIAVEVGCERDACRALNAPFLSLMERERPYVVAKYAMTLDGRIATVEGESKWITGADAREHVHRMRARYAAIMVGIGTVLADDPSLSARPATVEHPHQPLRVICDSRMRLPLGAEVVRSAHEQPTVIATCVADPTRWAPYEAAGAEVMLLDRTDPDGQPGGADLDQLMRLLAERGIDSVLVEGGSGLLGSLFDAGLVDEVCAFIAPKVFGGEAALSPVGGAGIAQAAQARAVSVEEVRMFGQDVLVRGTLVPDGCEEGE